MSKKNSSPKIRNDWAVCLFVLPSVWLVFVFPSSGCPSADLLSIFASLSKPPGLCPLPASVETADGGNMTY